MIENVEKASTQELEDIASALFASDFSSVSSDKAPFIWLRFRSYWAQMANPIPARPTLNTANNVNIAGLSLCAGVQHGLTRTAQGLRYLHCNLCETESHVMRVKCSDCEQSGKLHYWSLDDEQAAIKAESCDDCGTYLKILYQEKGPKVEAVADDLATWYWTRESSKRLCPWFR
ncbi:formate dehydrogenase accessory protein FdhE [Shigella sonnei]